jgi:hypothetical protein
MPLISFSATTREQQQSVFLSSQHTAVGVQLAQVRTAEQLCMLIPSPRHTALWLPAQIEKKGRSSAPPGAYRVPGAMDAQPESLKHTSPRFSFSHLNRMIVGGGRNQCHSMCYGAVH